MGKNLHLAKGGVFAHEAAELFLFRGAEEELAPDGAGNAVVDGDFAVKFSARCSHNKSPLIG